MKANAFENHVVWITGASSGIGRFLALEFAARGADLAISARRRDRLDSLVEELEGMGRRALAVPCDVSDEGAVEGAVRSIIAHFGKLDVAVANAGFGVAGAIEKLSAEDWRRQFDVNVVGAAMTARYAIPHLRETKGRLALVASVSSMLPIAKNGAYTASKYALRAIGQTLSIELKKSGVTCTTIHPGFVESDIARVDNDGAFHPDREDKRPAKLMWTTDRAARVMVRAIWRRKREYTFTAHGKVGAFLGKHAPGLVHFAMTRG